LPVFFEYFRPLDFVVGMVGAPEDPRLRLRKKKSGSISTANGGRTFGATDPAGLGEGLYFAVLCRNLQSEIEMQ